MNKMDANLESGMAESHSRSVVTLTISGIHLPLSDVEFNPRLLWSGRCGPCSRFTPKSLHSRLIAVLLTPRSPIFYFLKIGDLVFKTDKMGVTMFEAKAVIYTRLNSESEYDLFKKHTEICEEYALENDFYVFDVLSDYPQHKGLGRPGLTELLCTLGRERNMKVLINDLKTLSDDRIHLAHLQAMIEMLGSDLVVVNQEISNG